MNTIQVGWEEIDLYLYIVVAACEIKVPYYIAVSLLSDQLSGETDDHQR